MIKISEMRTRDVVNVNDGKRLGTIQDLDIDLENGTIKAIIIAGSEGLWGKFKGKSDYVIPWEKIVKVGIDTILVELPEESFNNNNK